MADTDKKEEDTRGLGLAVVLSILLAVVAAGIAFYASAELAKGKSWSALSTFGIALIVFGGCFSPTNFLWLLLPWTSQPIRPKSRT